MESRIKFCNRMRTAQIAEIQAKVDIVREKSYAQIGWVIAIDISNRNAHKGLVAAVVVTDSIAKAIQSIKPIIGRI